MQLLSLVGRLAYFPGCVVSYVLGGLPVPEQIMGIFLISHLDLFRSRLVC